MKNRLSLVLCALLCLVEIDAARGNVDIVNDGKPMADIVIAENPPRLAKLAAEELRDYVRKISGAELPIVSAPTNAVPVKIYVGRSAYTDKLGISSEGLKHGAYRMISGPDWLVLLGHDADFEPREPWPRTAGDYPKTQAAWEKIYGGTCANPMNWYGGPVTSFSKPAKVWKQDQGGSLQAVYAFLRDLGVRWYMPGELGEVVPEKKTIALPDVNRAVQPDFAIRNLYWWNRFSQATRDDILWWLRLGMNDGSEVLGASMQVHGMRMIQGNKAMQEAHPEYYALYGNKRDTEFRGTGHACFSSPGLQRETIKYLRAAFDHFDEAAMDLWPQDGYHHCGCELCKEKAPSDLVFGFVDRVARELYKTHPNKLITCGAYGSYVYPPGSIERFTPNVAIYISNRGRPTFDDPDRWQEYWSTIEGWRAKLAPGHIIRGENNLYDKRLVIHPRAYARDLRALKGISLGDICEVPRGRSQQWENPGVNHLNYYVQSRLLWDAGQNLDALLDEYYKLFYGPAADAMKSALEYAEKHYARRGPAGLSLEDQVQFTEKLLAARNQAGDTVYGRRIQAIMDELPTLEKLNAELKAKREAGDPRKNAPVAFGCDLPGPADRPVYKLRGIVDGAEPEVETKFTVGWETNTLVFDITCREPEMAKLFVTPDIWGGDSVAILLESPFHSYYQIEVNPDGVLFDADREFSAVKDQWNSQAKVRTERGADYWRVIVSIPVVPEVEGAGDPLHNVVGGKPGAAAPWYFNVGRVRVRGPNEEDRTAYTFSPTGGKTYHAKDKFGRLEIR